MKKGLIGLVSAVGLALGIELARAEAPMNRYEIAERLDLPAPADAAQTGEPMFHQRRPDAGVPDPRLVADLLVESIIQLESSGDPSKIGSRGERGLMQIMSRTWAEVTARHFGRRIPFSSAFDPELNRRVGAAYLSDLQAFLARHRSRWKADERALLLACYNAGPERVRAAGFDIRRLPASTRDYVQRGVALHEALLEDHNISSRQVRLAMEAVRRGGGA
ncbi:MAG: lytic transglycosylase domain-containing protein [Kiritimatiellae bacterium]|nr:lytic transglycosylase domain-containing protein [Kiritimatiellia bacterium]MDW8457741.1 lytic transglycosylase domain-containing protein [Verrucomicrobiota bacterium]